ncbi:MAG: PKD domain-containing protein [Flavobacteriales bacterium]|nr:PKD domain-containing protein [Flavobacteriales bacterium]
MRIQTAGTHVYQSMNSARNMMIRPALFVMLLLPTLVFGQCPEVFDFNGNVVATPYWHGCSGGDYTLNLQSPDDWDSHEIDWGDGTAFTTGPSWTSPAAIPHTYTAAVDTFIVVISELTSGCSVQGVVVMEEASSASIQIPVGGLTQACAPQEMEFINSATNVSETTVFTWDYGDGSPVETYDYTNWNEIVSHTYEQNTVDCETEVSLTAENYCNTIQGGASEATFNPIRIWDIDEAAITASATVLCYPDTTVTFTNTTERNCLFQGNIYQRYEYWNFGDYWGEGQDSIIDWTPWPPTFPNTVAYPGLGTYEVQLLDSNFCGIDTANITITIVPPPAADIDASEDVICVGEPITFFQNATGGADSYSWNFDDGIGWLPTGGGNITYVFNTPGTYNVCSAVGIQSSNGGCADTTCVPVEVLPSPIANIGFDDLVGCDELTVNFDDQSTGAVAYTWSFDVDPFTFVGPDPGPVDYNAPGNYVVTLSVEGLNGCLDTDQEIVSVYESPTADFLAVNVCEGTPAEFTDISTSDPGDPIISWFWEFGNGDESFNQNPTYVFDTVGTYDVTLTVSTATCTGTMTSQVVVEPGPTPSMFPDIDEGCSPLDVSFTNTTAGAINYQWNFGDGSGSNEENPTHTFTNYTETDTVYTVVMTAFTDFGCSAPDTVYVTVFPGAQAMFTDNTNPPGCAPFDAVFINTSIGADSYFWDMGDGFTTTDVDPTHTYVNETGFVQTFDVSLIAYKDNGCNDTTATNVIVYPTPDYNFSVIPDSACSPLVVTMPFIQGINVFDWDFGDGSPNSTFPTPTHIYENFTTNQLEYTITLIGTSAFGCIDTAYADINVDPQPIAQFSTTTNSGCSPLEVSFQNTSIQADSYTWIYQPGDTSYTADAVHQFTFTNTTNQTIVYDVELIAISDDGCVDNFIVPIQVFPEAEAEFFDPVDGCHPYNVNFFNTSSNAQDFQWDFGNGLVSLDENPSTILQNPGTTDSTYTVQLFVTSADGCSDLTSLDIVVHPLPDSEFNMSQDEGCHPAPGTLFNTSTGATEYLWDYGDGFQSNTLAAEHDHEFSSTSANPVIYDVSLTAVTEFGCTNTSSLPYTVYPLVTSDFDSSDDGCSPLTATFNNESLGATQGFEWDFGDGTGSVQTNPSITYVNNSGQDTTYNVMLVAESIYGCTDTSYFPVTVFATPIAIAAIDTTLGCYPLDVVFENNSIGADSYEWVYGTGDVSNTLDPLHTYTYFNFGTEPVTYNITLNAYTASGCSSSDQLSIEVQPPLVAAVDGDTEGCSPLTVLFENNTVGGISYFWDFDDGDTHTIPEPQHMFFNDTQEDVVYEVMMVAEGYTGCFDTTYIDVTVFANPDADFTATPQLQAFPDTDIDLMNESIAGASADYFWDMGDGTVLNGIDPGNYDYGTYGEFTITLTIDNGSCQDTFQQTIEITPPPPVAAFLGPASGCAPLTVNFEDFSEFVIGWNWDFGDGGTANVSNPSYTYYTPGTYTVSLTVDGLLAGTTDTQVQTAIIEVFPQAIAAFTVTPDEISVPGDPIYTVNLSQNATNYVWDFGDGTTSTEFNPIHYYQNEGFYTIELTANNQYNCPTTYTLVDAVFAKEDGQISFPNAFTPTNESNGGIYNPNGFSNDVFFPIHKGVIEYQIQVFNKWGELLFESNDLNIGWDGHYRNEMCKQDVYAWKVKARFIDGNEIIKAGDVTLLVK